MNEMWSGDRAVLVKVVDMYERCGAHFETAKLLETFPDEQHDDVQQSLRRLVAHGYIDAATTGPTYGDSRVHVLAIVGVTEKGLQAAGAYPASDEQAAHALLAAIDEAVKNAPNAEERSKLQALQSIFGGLSLNTLGGLATLLVAKVTGLA